MNPRLSIVFKFKQPIGQIGHVSAAKPVLKARQEMVLSIIAAREPIGTQQILSELADPPSEFVGSKTTSAIYTGLIKLQKGSVSVKTYPLTKKQKS